MGPATVTLRVVAALDSFKGSLDSLAAGDAVRRGVLSVDPSASVQVFPVADGGEGTIAAVAATVPSELVPVSCVDTLGRTIVASYLAVADGTSIIEAARTVGLDMLDVVDSTLPPRASSTGLGDQLARALTDSPGRVLVGLGGTACTDGGTGMLRALGADIDSETANPLWGFGGLDATTLPDLSRVHVLSDVTNPLLGPSGAARTFGPQKGATAEQVEHLEDQMVRWADALERSGREVAAHPGAGAAGGLGAALIACGARLTSGFDEVARLTGIARAIADTDLVITGEGSLDAQTDRGKAPAGVASLARGAGAIVVGLGGRVDRPASNAFDAVFPIHGQPRPLIDALDPDLTAAELSASAAEIIRLLVTSRRPGP
ncbi:MAG: glycerate kinase [Jiangellaceae bacterium]